MIILSWVALSGSYANTVRRGTASDFARQALDRMERGTGEKSAVQEVREQYGIPVVAVVTLDNLVEFLGRDADRQAELQAVAAYRANYGV